MNPTRRAFVRGGVAATVWAWRPSARAQTPATAVPTALRAAEGSRQIAALPAPATPVAAYNGRIPGPLLRARIGETLALRLTNALAQPMTLSFPGLRLANALAGIGGLTQPALDPGASADIGFAPLDAGFNIYMPHAGAASAAQIARGLYGPIVVDEAAPPQVDLDAIVLLCGWPLSPGGGVEELGDASLERGAGRSGEVITANDAAAPLALSAAPGARVRLRLANAATRRVMTLAIQGAKTLIVAVDGQPSEPFEPLRDLVPIAPGARFELMFDLPREAGGKVSFVLLGAAGEPDRPVIALEASGEAVPARAAITGLPENPRLPKEIELERAQRFDLALTGGGEAPFALGGASFAGWDAKPAFAVPRGAPVTLALTNKTAYPQAMRLGGHVARLLHALDDGWEPYWRDIILIPPGRTVHAAFVADNLGKWPIESASPERRNAGLAAWFQVG